MNAAISVMSALRAPLAVNSEPTRLAEAFRRSCYELGGLPTLVRWARAWWRYNGVRYVEHDDEVLERDLIRFLDVCVVETTDDEGNVRRVRVTAKKRHVSELRHALAFVMPILEGGAPQWTSRQPNDPNPDDFVPCANGVLDLGKLQLVTPTPRLFATNAIGCAWIPDAPPAQRWFAFLHELWGDDDQSIRALQQIFGYLLTPDTQHQKLFGIVGPKRSGKSTIARVLKALLGDEAVVNPTLSSLERPFGLAPLVGKTVAIIGDARLGGRADQATVVERLLSISGEDPISVDRKNRDAVNVRLRTRVLLISNELPKLYDTSGALASRFLILTTTKSFIGNEDTHLEAALVAELPGILKWAVEGREDLRENGRFITPAASEQAIAALEDIGSPTKVFLREKCELGPQHEVEIELLWEDWKMWCKANGREPLNKQVFGRDLQTAIPTLSQTYRRRPDGSRRRYYMGVRLV